MILLLLLNILAGAFTLVFGLFPKVETLPLGMDTALVTAVGYFKTLMASFPPLSVLFTALLWYLGYKGVIMLVKLIMGSRSPVNL